jgi:RNA polymerase-binding protein DksA
MAVTPRQLEGLRAQIETRARVLREQVENARADIEATPTALQDPAEDTAAHGEQRSRDAVRSAEQNRDTGELREIAAALTRMDEGRYGECIHCGRDIPFARLEVQPTALRCVPCQQRFEKAHPTEIRAAPMH